MMYCVKPKAWALLLLSAAILLSGCGGGGGGSTPTSTIPTIPAPPALQTNEMVVYVDRGPVGYNVNRLYADITLCKPGTNTCQTIDHLLVDTGSTGLRILSSVLSPSLGLQPVAASNGQPLLNCVQFADASFVWGSVARADLSLGGKTASAIPIQVIADPVYQNFADRCSTGEQNNTVQQLGANGILGLSMFHEDCGVGCTTFANIGVYFACTNAACTAITPSTANLASQIKNPVPLFASESNGFLLSLPAVSGLGGESLQGRIAFGLGTRDNNQVTGMLALTTNSVGDIATVYAGRTLPNSFLDTGSNGNYFDTPALPQCPDSNISSFYCPTTPTIVSATLVGRNSNRVDNTFTVQNARQLFDNRSNTVLPGLAGTFGDAQSFDWGLPFFMGRRVAIGIEQQNTPLGTGPLYGL